MHIQFVFCIILLLIIMHKKFKILQWKIYSLFHNSVELNISYRNGVRQGRRRLPFYRFFFTVLPLPLFLVKKREIKCIG
jgi:hypothetical protein